MPESNSGTVGEVHPGVTPEMPEYRLLDEKELARAALLEVADASELGSFSGCEVSAPGVLTLYFNCEHPGYVGWRWAATVTAVDADAAATVMEVHLLPGNDALVAPEWLPWSQRLALYRETQARLAADEAAAAEAAAFELQEEDDIDPEEDLLTNDFSDFDDEIDGVQLEGEDEDEAGGEDEVGDLEVDEGYYSLDAAGSLGSDYE